MPRRLYGFEELGQGLGQLATGVARAPGAALGPVVGMLLKGKLDENARAREDAYRQQQREDNLRIKGFEKKPVFESAAAVADRNLAAGRNPKTPADAQRATENIAADQLARITGMPGMGAMPAIMSQQIAKNANEGYYDPAQIGEEWVKTPVPPKTTAKGYDPTKSAGNPNEIYDSARAATKPPRMAEIEMILQAVQADPNKSPDEKATLAEGLMRARQEEMQRWDADARSETVRRLQIAVQSGAMPQAVADSWLRTYGAGGAPPPPGVGADGVPDMLRRPPPPTGPAAVTAPASTPPQPVVVPGGLESLSDDDLEAAMQQTDVAMQQAIAALPPTGPHRTNQAQTGPLPDAVGQGALSRIGTGASTSPLAAFNALRGVPRPPDSIPMAPPAAGAPSPAMQAELERQMNEQLQRVGRAPAPPSAPAPSPASRVMEMERGDAIDRAPMLPAPTPTPQPPPAPPSMIDNIRGGLDAAADAYRNPAGGYAGDLAAMGAGALAGGAVGSFLAPGIGTAIGGGLGGGLLGLGRMLNRATGGFDHAPPPALGAGGRGPLVDTPVMQPGPWRNPVSFVPAGAGGNVMLAPEAAASFDRVLASLSPGARHAIETSREISSARGLTPEAHAQIRAAAPGIGQLDQTTAWNNFQAGGPPALRPDAPANHSAGTSIDIPATARTDEVVRALLANGWRRHPTEPWHFDYIGGG